MGVLVTGGHGLLGSAISAAFTRAGHDVTASGSHDFDIADPVQTAEAIAALRPNLIVHSAAYTDVDGCERDSDLAFRINRDGAKNVAQAAQDAGARLIAISTDFVFDGLKGAPYVESDATNPLCVYGVAKRAGEELIAGACEDHKIVRTSWLFGANGKCFPKTILAALAQGRPLHVVRDQIGVPSFARDIAESLVALAPRDETGIFHITNAGECSWYAYACAILRLTGRPETLITPITSEEWPSPAHRPAYSVLQSKRWQELGQKPLRPWQDALAEFLQSAF